MLTKRSPKRELIHFFSITFWLLILRCVMECLWNTQRVMRHVVEIYQIGIFGNFLTQRTLTLCSFSDSENRIFNPFSGANFPSYFRGTTSGELSWWDINNHGGNLIINWFREFFSSFSSWVNLWFVFFVKSQTNFKHLRVGGKMKTRLKF